MSASPPPQSCFWLISQLPGVNDTTVSQLADCGIVTTRELLQTPADSLAQQLNLPIRHVKKWHALADLARIPSVGCIYSGMLLHGGIISVQQLAQTLPQRLHQQLLRLSVATLRDREFCPSVNEIQHWIQQAQSLSKS